MHRGPLPVAVALLALSIGGAAQERPLRGAGFHYCAPPSQPFCAGEEATFSRETTLAACTRSFNRYIDSVFVYRACLEKETKRAVAEANDELAAFKCRAAGRRHCP